MLAPVLWGQVQGGAGETLEMAAGPAAVVAAIARAASRRVLESMAAEKCCMIGPPDHAIVSQRSDLASLQPPVELGPGGPT